MPRSPQWIDAIRRDIGFAIRGLRRAPLFSLFSVLTLALGIGANTAVFEVVRAVLLDGLPYRDADRLVRVYTRFDANPGERSSMSAGLVTDLMERQRSFEGLTAFAHYRPDVVLAGERPRVVTAGVVDGSFFDVLGTRAVLGRLLTRADARPGAPRVVVVGYRAWRDLFGADPAILARPIEVNGISHEVVGVASADFVGPMGRPDLWVPLDLGPTLRDPVSARGSHWLGVVGRLRPEIDIEVAERELAVAAAEVGRIHPTQSGQSVIAVPLREAMVGESRPALLILMASASLVLMITCANLAGALMGRAVARRRELALRLALGASRSRLIRQLLTESAVVATAGGVAGAGLAVLALRLIDRLMTTALPGHADIGIDGVSLAVTAVLTLLCGIGFGLGPALVITRDDPRHALREGAGGSGEGRRARRLRGILVTAQIAVSATLLAGAGLLVRSLVMMLDTPFGYRTAGVLTAQIPLLRQAYPSSAARIGFHDRLVERVRSMPGVLAVASTSELPMASMNRNGLAIEGVSWPSASQPFIDFVTVSEDYFRLLGIRTIAGRTFEPADHELATGAIVISESLSRRYWPTGTAIGARVRFGPHGNAPWSVVIGVVSDVRTDPAQPAVQPMAYGSFRQGGWSSRTILIWGLGDDPGAWRRPLEAAVAGLDPTVPVTAVAPLAGVVSESLSARRLPVVLMAAFGALAVILATLGVYALYATATAARQRELGVRIALGASRGRIVGLILRDGGGWMAAGLGIGAIGVLVIGKVLSGLLAGLDPLDPSVLGATGGILLAAGAIALLSPLRKALGSDPVSVLR